MGFEQPLPPEVSDMLSGTSPGSTNSDVPLGFQPTPETPQTPESIGAKLPALYSPGPDSPARQALDNGFWGTVTNVMQRMQNMGLPPGEMPSSFKMQLAAQKANLDQQEMSLKFKNYNDSHELAQQTIRMHNADMMAHGIKISADAKDSIYMAKPEDKANVTAWWEKTLNGFGDGLGAIATMTAEDPGRTYILDFMASKSPDIQKQIQSQGYANTMKDPNVQAAVKVVGGDFLTAAMSEMPRPLKDKAQAGTLTENEFLAALPSTILNTQGLTPLALRAAQAYAQGEHGQQVMAGLGVKLNAAAQAQQMHAKSGGAGGWKNAAQEAEFHQINTQLQTETDPKRRAKLTDQREVLIGLQNKENSVSKTANDYNVATSTLTNGEYSTWGDFSQALELNPDLAPKATEILEKVTSMRAQGTQNVALNKLQDISTKNVYDASEMAKGNLINVKKPLTARDLTSGKYIQPDDKTIAQFQQIAQSARQAHELFGTAQSLFKAKSSWDVIKQKAIQTDVEQFGWLGAAARHDPKWKVYTEQLAAWSSTDARTLGTERGVMTDTDVKRWTSVFPNATDTEATTKAKIALFDKMVDYVIRTNIQIISGHINLLGDKADQDKNASTIQGYLGRAEQLNGGPGAGTVEKKPRAQTLREQMVREAGK
jgi:hypothetical protein